MALVKSDGTTIAFIQVFASKIEDNYFKNVIHGGIREAIKNLIDEGFLTSAEKETTVSIQSGNTNKVPNFDRIYDALIQHMILRGFKRL